MWNRVGTIPSAQGKPLCTWPNPRHLPSSGRVSTLNTHRKDWCWSWSSILWLPDVKSQLIGKDPEAGKDWRQEEKGMTEDEMVGWHHRLNGHEFEQALGDGEGQRRLVCCSPWDHRVRHDWVTELNWTNAGKDWRQEEKWVIEDKMVGWHHWLNGHEFEQALGDGEGEGSLACCSPWGYKELDMTEQLNNKCY